MGHVALRVMAGWVAVLALATPAAAQAPTGDSVRGTLAVTRDECTPDDTPFSCAPPNRYGFDAHSGAAGQNAGGTVGYVIGSRATAFFDDGTVSCLSVAGTRASIGVDFGGSAQFGPPVPHGAVMFVEDNGGEGQDLLAVHELGAGVQAPSSCPAGPPAGVTPGPTYSALFLNADVTVTDAPPPPPASTQECSGGGWQTLGFEAHRDCIRAVEQQARQECIFIRAAHGAPAFRTWFGSGIEKRHAMRRCVRQRSRE